MDVSPYNLKNVLKIAARHPLYNSNIVYPPSRQQLTQILDQEDEQYSLQDFDTVTKKELSDVISRLLSDDSPDNTYRHHSYTTITGGGFKRGVPLLWLTDSLENRHHRAAAGRLLEVAGVIEPTDMVVNIHVAGHFYRSLDLTTDYMEHAGATVLPAGSDMSPETVTETLIRYRANCLSGPVAELIKVALHISRLPADRRAAIKVTKLYYTSEPICKAQSRFLHRIFGAVTIYSALGSAEIGVWGIHNPELTGEDTNHDNAIDYIFDTRSMLVEILPTDATSDVKGTNDTSDEVIGNIVVTSLQRLRNPLVRYNSGDLGSMHPLPEAAWSRIPAGERDRYRVIRMYGRDPRFTFECNGHSFQYASLAQLIQKPGWNILQWQIVIRPCQDGGDHVTVLLLRDCEGNGGLSNADLALELKAAFPADSNERFCLDFVDDLRGFERSTTGQKVIRLVDLRNQSRDE